MSMTPEELRKKRELKKAKKKKRCKNPYHHQVTFKRQRKLSIFDLFKHARW